jgi:hypothetical protein
MDNVKRPNVVLQPFWDYHQDDGDRGDISNIVFNEI